MIGRKKESAELNRLYNSSKAELVAVYGRKCVGKTYLINEVFKDRIAFHHAGLSPADLTKGKEMKEQLEHFYFSLRLQGMKGSSVPKSWLEAFFMLEVFLQQTDQGGRQVVFLDELPWMDTPKSGFISAFEGFWNTWGCSRHNLMVIVCGSASSWISDKLINSQGGLYNRVTYEIEVQPFDLSECEAFYKDLNIRFSRYDIVQSYMILGGIPYYMGYMKPGLSLAQNVDQLFFTKKAKLRDEYNRLFGSVFNRPETMKSIVEFLFSRSYGYTRKEIAEGTGQPLGGSLSESLRALAACDFITAYTPFGKKMGEHYKLTDPFCLFYLQFVKNRESVDEYFWQHNVTSQQLSSWRGLAFENVCFTHVWQIKKALGIEGVISSHSVWTKKTDETEGTQIDLLIIRKDNVINMCEMKFYSEEFAVTKQYNQALTRQTGILSEKVSPKFSIYSTLITTYGLKYNEYSGAFTSVVTLDDLFVQ